MKSKLTIEDTTYVYSHKTVEQGRLAERALLNAENIGEWPGDERAGPWEGPWENKMLKKAVIINAFNAVGLAEGWMDGTEEDVLNAWQYLHDSGLAYKLQGFFGRAVIEMLQAGVINE